MLQCTCSILACCSWFALVNFLHTIHCRSLREIPYAGGKQDVLRGWGSPQELTVQAFNLNGSLLFPFALPQLASLLEFFTDSAPFCVFLQFFHYYFGVSIALYIVVLQVLHKFSVCTVYWSLQTSMSKAEGSCFSLALHMYTVHLVNFLLTTTLLQTLQYL